MNMLRTPGLVDKIKRYLSENIPGLDPEMVEIDDFIEAFTHPSYKGMVPGIRDYQRLEFLGDSVIQLIVADELVRESQDSEESMTEKRKQIVNNESLAVIFDYVKLHQIILIPPNFALSTKPKGDFVEAFIGALYLNIRFEEVKEIWDELLYKAKLRQKKKAKPTIPKAILKEKSVTQQFFQSLGLKPKNPKSVLQELSQKQGLGIPEYELISRTGPDHNPLFRVRVTMKVDIEGRVRTKVAEAEGASKQKAEVEAAKKLCDEFGLAYENA